MNLKRVAITLLIGLFLYLSLYTWNARTGALDALAARSGLDAVALVLRPGRLLGEGISRVWTGYAHLVGVAAENARLRAERDSLLLANASLRERAQVAQRLEALLGFTPPPQWGMQGARIIGHRMGPNALLETVVVDKGSLNRASVGMVAVSPRGLVGRVLRTGLTSATLLLVQDPDSRIAVLGQEDRVAGILAGQGPGRPLQLRYVSRTASMQPGEILVTSGLAGQYPKGLPVARVSRVTRSDPSLFLDIEAQPLEDVQALEEVLLLHPLVQVQAAAPDAEGK